MAIIETISDTHHFWLWVNHSDTYKNNFTMAGAYAVQEYYDTLSDDLGENIEFDPVAWCCEFSEYSSFEEFQHDTGYIQNGKQYDGYPDIESLDDLRDHTTVVEFDGGILVAEF